MLKWIDDAELRRCWRMRVVFGAAEGRDARTKTVSGVPVNTLFGRVARRTETVERSRRPSRVCIGVYQPKQGLDDGLLGMREAASHLEIHSPDWGDALVSSS